ncbi:hypothetical protein AVEN_51626-1 [Araneus ventricosus]|uniref:Uncharacterized protein n=1 Tax=Araneus ventricosus TaxID=182803 RepID=A0A4Y2WYL6_ARAVE|nr:hypothetical protein AVEN_258164-1 [Araneus ventricosus]GBO42349.1 hypothetical protein AVEN_51626-1 [Araneus ventricosus]
MLQAIWSAKIWMRIFIVRGNVWSTSFFFHLARWVIKDVGALGQKSFITIRSSRTQQGIGYQLYQVQKYQVKVSGKSEYQCQPVPDTTEPGINPTLERDERRTRRESQGPIAV